VNSGFVPRALTPTVLVGLAESRVVVLEGARQVGKSTLAEAVAVERGGRVVTMDDQDMRVAATEDPVSVADLGGDGLLVIDEVQRVPAVVLAVKARVDRNKRPGQFLLTGSANVSRLPEVGDALAGRAEVATLYGFSQGELHGRADSFVDRALEGRLPAGHNSRLQRRDYMDLVVAGSYPEPGSRPANRRGRWYASYLSLVAGRDAADISGLRRLRDLPRVLEMIAARQGSEMVVASLANDAGLPRRTLDPYLALLDTLYLTHDLLSWSTSLTKRAVKAHKTYLLDTGLAAHLLNLAAPGLEPGRNADAAGGLVEAFAVGELRRQLGWSQTTARLAHFRDSDGHEVDIILEAADGRVVGVEVKAAASFQAKDARGLIHLREKLGERFVAGLVLHTGPRQVPLGKRISAAPLDLLWS
jgi:predicted AAA+ superfamily ATPase